MRIFIGYDQREEMAYEVAADSLRKYGHESIPLLAERLRACGMLTRPVDTRGQMFDLISGAPQSTDFAAARFFVPLLAHCGWALGGECDMLFLRDPRQLERLADPRYAVMVVKHGSHSSPETKMDGQRQTTYARKWWSSLALWNCDHPANRRLNLQMLNTWPGRDLHAFGWLADDEIGALPAEWNWLVGIQPEPADPAVAHYTCGGPWLKNWPGGEYDELWKHHAAISAR